MDANAEKKAAAVLLLLAAGGLVARFALSGGGAPGEVLYREAAAERPRRDSVAARAVRLAQPLKRGERIDIDRASVEDVSRLPRVGPGLAARIVSHRERHGPFGSLSALDQVPGVGEGLLNAIRPHVTFSAHGGDVGHGGQSDRSGGRADWRAGGRNGGQAVRRTGGQQEPRVDRPSARPSVRRSPVRPSARPPIHLNTASAEELESLPGIGPSLAAAIVADRKTNGAYRALSDLARVRGIGPATLERIKDRVSVP